MCKVLFVIDKLEYKYFEFNKLVTNFWLIKEFIEQGKDVYITTISKLFLCSKTALTTCYKASFTDDLIYDEKEELIEINNFDTVMFRPDPPVDIDYINATYIFDFVDKPRVINSPCAIRNFNEKLHSLYFSEYMVDTIITSSMAEIETFLQKNGEIVLKPLNQCFGAGVMYLYNGDPNTHTIINTVTKNETTYVMVQQYIPEVKHGDKRILTLGEEILPYAIKKLPGKDDFKFNNHSAPYIVKYEISEEEINHFKPVAKKLNSMGIEMAGLDVINQNIIEINVTSPCYFINEINNLYNINLEKRLVSYICKANLLYI